jgi:hypothetical protein
MYYTAFVISSREQYDHMLKVYAHLPHVQVKPLFFTMNDLNVTRMMNLMAIEDGETKPLYIQVVQKLLRDIGDPFDYNLFRRELEKVEFTKLQQVRVFYG